jgi:glycosyltransferase involved in cell wall biosynthesis
MEAAVVRYADRIAVTTPRMRQAMTARYPESAEKFLWVPNSIDVDRTRTVAPIEKYEPLTIAYAGVLYFDRTPEPLFRAVAELLKSGDAAPADLRIKLVGQCRQINGVDTMTIARRYGIEEVVELVDRVPYAEAIRIMQRSHVLLMLAPARHRLVVPAKIYDYLGTGSSILAIAEDGATSDLVAETQCGRCFSAQDATGMAAYLAALLKDRAYERIANDPRTFARYEARHVTEQLIAGLSNVDAVSIHQVVART